MWPVIKTNMLCVAVECYQRVKQALHTALPDRLVCRDHEMKAVNVFLDGHLQKKTSGSLYICGAPGTGKTAVISLTRQRLQVGLFIYDRLVGCTFLP